MAFTIDNALGMLE